MEPVSIAEIWSRLWEDFHILVLMWIFLGSVAWFAHIVLKNWVWPRIWPDKKDDDSS